MIRLRVSRQSAGEKLRALARSRAFAGLRLDELAEVAPLLTRTRVGAGIVLTGEERADGALYLVVRGAVELRRRGALLRCATAGDCFTGSGVTARTLTPVTLLLAPPAQRRRIAELTGGTDVAGRPVPAPVFDFRRRRLTGSSPVRALDVR